MFEFFDYFRKSEISRPRANQIVFQSEDSDYEAELFKFEEDSREDILKQGDFDEA